jgi:hypothetical protein
MYVLLCGALVAFHAPSVWAQDEDEEQERDPFIPLITEQGDLRQSFIKPSEEINLPAITVYGISKVGANFYALIDGELVKEGDTIKGIKIVKITSDRIEVKYKNKSFQIKWEPQG